MMDSTTISMRWDSFPVKDIYFFYVESRIDLVSPPIRYTKKLSLQDFRNMIATQEISFEVPKMEVNFS